MAVTMPLWEREKGSKVPGKKAAALSRHSKRKGPLSMRCFTAKR